ncbi:MAG: hypothetical protein COU31_04620 [Candidatus Magasanikbacteria bacterium CG10_big_fil_rev_8_21_14_0_10_40_10]|uniref:Glycosyltransferase family 1 protein n=1 Tax=Candidatus Magasanikbacteria bacterium CG10_big_fil_rev_8_21_14_0_10_40_10 TaxID=1974648 RepID=A0A2M6W2W8_9BACT|nr:MAG: hypothetical protein COU31_04620 [Candidatus Magasanikbacteria bacterium CG10_big_fil_rev_8_21_14_0_10_40_10]
MRVLQIHKYFYRRAGAESVFLDTIEGLRKRGHEVAEFSVKYDKNQPSEYANYFVNTEPELSKKQLDFLTMARLFGHFIFSSQVNKKLRALVAVSEPQVAHLHNVVHQLSATTFKTLRKLKVPIVYTVHDVQPMCPNHRMITQGNLCEKCFKHRYYNCLRYKCIADSRLKSLSGMLEAYYYYLRGIWNMVDIFVCPSEFMRDKMIEWGFERKKIRLLRNFHQAPAQIKPLGNKIVYLNRLHEEKGIKVFMEATRKLRQYQIIVAGDGPQDDWVKKQIKQFSLTHVQKIGRVQGEEWKKIMADARVVVVPSLFYENCSISILEALANGRLVVASDRGGNSELITQGQTGFLADAQDPDSFSIFIKEAMEMPEEKSSQIIANGRRLVMDQHDKDEYFNQLENIYQELAK